VTNEGVISIKFVNETKRAMPYITPMLIAIIIVSIYPFVTGIVNSLFSKGLLSRKEMFVGLQNFAALFKDSLFWLGLKNNLIWTFSCVGMEFILGMLIALLLNLPFVRFKNIYRALVLLPWATPPVVAGLIWRYILSSTGPLNTMLKDSGIVPNPPSWLVTPGYSLLACIVTNIWMGLPFMTVMLLAGLQAIPRDIYEAAEIDGANAFRRLFSITLPVMKNIIAVVLILMCIWTFNMFDIVYVMTNGGPGNSSMILSLYGYQNAFAYHQKGYGAAIGVVSLLLLLFPISLYIKGASRHHEA